MASPMDGSGKDKRKRFRVPRSCDRCRRSKTKCIFEGGDRCNACAGAQAHCTFANPGSLKERAPTLKDIEHLNARVRSLERLLVAAKPDIDLGHLSGDAGRRLDDLSRSPSSIDSLDDPTAGLSPFDLAAGDLGSVSDAFACLALDERALRVASWSDPSDTSRSPADASEVDLVMTRWRDWKIRTFTDPAWPPPDLEMTLIRVFFRDAHPALPILNPRHFLQSHAAGLHRTDITFRALCFAVFAVASVYIDDPRLRAPESDAEPIERNVSGFKFARASHVVLWGFAHPAGLHELQSWCLLTQWFFYGGSPMLLWSLAGQGLRRAGSIGVHREHSPKWTADPLQDFLRRRVFFEIFWRECVYSNAMGRAPLMKPSDFDLQPPDPALDQHYGTFEHPFHDASIYSPQESLVALSMWHQLVWHPHSVGMTMVRTFFDWSSPGKMKRGQLVDVAKKLERDIKTRLDAFKRSLPECLRWGDQMNDGTLIHAAKLAAMPHYFMMNLYRRLHIFDPSDMGALCKCAQEAAAIIEICSVLRKRNVLRFCVNWALFHAATSGIMTMYTLGRRGAPSADDMMVYVRRVEEVLSILWDLADVAFIAKKAHSSITRFLTWTSLRAEAELAQKTVDERTGKEVYRMCIAIARALSAGTLDEHLEQQSEALRDPTTVPQAAPSSLTTACLPGPGVSEAPISAMPPEHLAPTVAPTPVLKDGADPMYVDFNPLAFEVTSLLSPNEMWAAGPSGSSIEPLLAEGGDWASGGGKVHGEQPEVAWAAPSSLKQHDQAPSPPESWQALLAMLNTAPGPDADASGQPPNFEMHDPFGIEGLAATGFDNMNGVQPTSAHLWGESNEFPPPYYPQGSQTDIFSFLGQSAV